MTSVQQVGRVIERAYGADALTVACQDGRAAGQTIPHVHFHLLPRKFKGDRFSDRPDDVYPTLERVEGALPEDLAALRHATDARVAGGHEPLQVDADDDRLPRSMDEMEKEAKWLQTFFEESQSV